MSTDFKKLVAKRELARRRMQSVIDEEERVKSLSTSELEEIVGEDEPKEKES